MGMLIWWKLVAISLHILSPICSCAATASASPGSEAVRLLLAFKHSSVSSDPLGLLSDWKPYSSSCCSWRGISCSPDGEVVSLNLSHGGLSGSLHLSHLTSLPSLRHVFLQGNSLELSNSNPNPNPNPKCALETLDLSSNNLSAPLPNSSFLISCQRLSLLNLSRNSIPDFDFEFGHPSLLQLDLSGNRLSGWPRSLSSSCLQLSLLNLSDNMLRGQPVMSSCSSFGSLDLSYNLLSGTIPSSLLLLPRLNNLDLSFNNFSTDLASLHFGNCSSLTSLRLSRASLYGSGNSFPLTLSNCLLLHTLDLSHNHLRSPIPTPLPTSLPNLRTLSLSHNNFSGHIPPSLGRLLCPTLHHLDLSANQLSGGFPATFASCSSPPLHTLNLASNQLSGDFLSTVITNLLNLTFLYLPFNNITGELPLSLVNCTRLQVLDLSSNALTGNIPTGLCSHSSLEKILLANNFLSGAVPVELASCHKLSSIDLSFNALSGPIPPEIWRLPRLSDLILWANNLTGTIPQGICVDGGNLQMLILNNNLLHGSIPQSIANCTNMIWISLSSNRLTGEIPPGIGSLTNLAILQLGNNSLSGTIPPEIGQCRSLIWLDLNSNNLSGSIPSQLADQAGLLVAGIVSGKQFAFVRNEGGTACRGAGGLIEFQGVRAERLEMYPMVHSCPSTRIYSGMTVYTFSNNGSMIYLDLSYNALSGTIPEKLGAMSYLQVLNLGHNTLTGNIPYSFGGLRLIGVLDLSHNSLDGFLPGALATLSFLNDLDVSNNNLTGPIPSGGQLTTFPASRYENNSAGLCGLPLPPCGTHGRRVGDKGHGRKQSVAAGMIIGITFSVLCILILTLALHRVKKQQMQKDIEKNRENKCVESLPTSGGGGSSGWKLSGVPEPLSINVATFEKPLRKLTFAHLVEATNGFSADSLVGSGGFGEVYKAQLKDGCVVAIKKLIQVTGQGDREFMAEMETIGKIKHRNLVPLLGYCKIGEERLLVYEYMKWGSLESVLHDHKSKGTVLGWGARRKIAIGSARGLAFLHHSCIPHIIHRDMKSSNVLLDEEFEARVSDFGMARLVNALDTHLSVSTLAGTPGYVPPEYYQSFRCTTKGDVYSYGVVLLELLSGKRPIDPVEFGDDNNLVGWAKQLRREKRSREIVDPELDDNETEAELCHFMRIAFECLDDRPLRRPTMIQVMAMFKELHHEIDNSVGTSISTSSSNSDILDAFSLNQTHHVIHDSS